MALDIVLNVVLNLNVGLNVLLTRKFKNQHVAGIFLPEGKKNTSKNTLD